MNLGRIIESPKNFGVAFLLLFITGCATNWHNPHIRDAAAEKKQLSIDDAYCRSVAYGSVPMPNIRIYNHEQSSYRIDATANTYNYGTHQYSTSNIMGTARPMPADDFYGGLARGFSSGIALGAALKAKEDRDAIQYGCMLRLGWEEGKRDELSHVRKASKFSKPSRDQSIDTQSKLKKCIEINLAVETAIARVPKLAHVRTQNPDIFKTIASIDVALKDQPVWQGRPLAERFNAALHAYETTYGELPYADSVSLTNEILEEIAGKVRESCKLKNSG